ncbi:hypothetical protein [Gemmatimonas sp. UBA7669]|uniref:hypothetical protein n=1 Tax=Gemmatimonas sp. UBA7669 TaxID=1946568 RepID=UPI0025C693A6|nr:hypothetical protein [Gemmatimonas sp. UBA7669]
MSAVELVLLVLSTAVTVATAMALAGLFVIRLVVAKDLAPFGVSLAELKAILTDLVARLDEHRRVTDNNTNELHGLVDALKTTTTDLVVRVSLLEQSHRHA